MEWLAGMPGLDGAGGVWAASAAININNLGGDVVLRYTTTILNTNLHQEVMSRRLPTAYPIGGEPWRMCVDTRLSASTVGARAVAPASDIDGALTTRVALGRWDPTAAPPSLGRVFVQHNPSYDPIDDPDTGSPFEPSPNGNGGVPVIGGAATIGQPGFDYYDTGVSLVFGSSWRILCIGVAPDGTLEGSYGGVEFVGGSTGVVINAFAPSIDHVAFEVESALSNQSLFIDDLALDCIDLPLVALPALTVPYHDPLNWGIEGVTIRAFDDDGFPGTPFRWTSASRTPFVADDSGLAVSSENYFADTSQPPGQFSLFVKAATELPVIGSVGGAGFVVGSDARLTDFQTTRAWAAGDADSLHAALAFSAGTGTFWSFGVDTAVRGAAGWTDTGVTPADLSISANDWFSVRIVRQPDDRFTFRINGAALVDDGGALIRVESASGNTALGRWLFLGGDDLGAAPGSSLVFDNIRAWALPCAGDTNDDGQVTFTDLNAILGAFGQNVGLYDPRDLAPDADGDGFGDDGVVNFADLNAALGGFNTPCN